MTVRLPQRKDKIPPEHLAEAAVWVARLHSGETDRTAMLGVKQWLKAHPMNGRALEQCTQIWEESANLRRITPFATQIPAPPRRYRLVAVAVAASLLALGMTFWLVLRAQVSTEVGEQRLVVLKDGTHVFLNTATRIDVRYDASIRLVELKTGEALFDVAKKPT